MVGIPTNKKITMKRIFSLAFLALLATAIAVQAATPKTWEVKVRAPYLILDLEPAKPIDRYISHISIHAKCLIGRQTG